MKPSVHFYQTPPFWWGILLLVGEGISWSADNGSARFLGLASGFFLVAYSWYQH